VTSASLLQLSHFSAIGEGVAIRGNKVRFYVKANYSNRKEYSSPTGITEVTNYSTCSQEVRKVLKRKLC
jgi:hypothetical protein